MIKALGGVLQYNDLVKMLAVALEGLDNTLACGQKHYLTEEGENRYAIIFEQEGCLDHLENLQTHPNHQIYKSTLSIIEKYFNDDTESDPLIEALNQAQQ